MRLVFRFVGQFLVAITVFVGWFVGEHDWGKRHALQITIIYTIGFLAFYNRDLPSKLRRKADHGIRVPQPGKPGKEALNRALSAIAGRLALRPQDELRLTLFVPDTQNKVLVQAARITWDDRTEVSGTQIRMGTCAVGHAFNRGEPWHVPNVDDHGGFEAALRWCGLTRDEVTQQTLRRRSFAAIPIFTVDGHGQTVPLGVVAADTATAKALRVDLHHIIVKFEAQLRSGLLGTKAPVQMAETAAGPLPDSGKAPTLRLTEHMGSTSDPRPLPMPVAIQNNPNPVDIDAGDPDGSGGEPG